MGRAPDASADGGQHCITSHVEAKGLGLSLLSREKFAFPVDVVISLLGTEFRPAVSFCVGLRKQQLIKSII